MRQLLLFATILVEIDGLYCDVIVRRWERFTGKQA